MGPVHGAELGHHDLFDIIHILSFGSFRAAVLYNEYSLDWLNSIRPTAVTFKKKKKKRLGEQVT